jgi:hypothetical protein
MAIILVDIGGYSIGYYSIGGYWCLLYRWILVMTRPQVLCWAQKNPIMSNCGSSLELGAAPSFQQ